jgi:alpha-galactosidase
VYRSVIAWTVLASSFAFSPCICGQTSARLETKQTILRFEAGASAPRLISLQTPGSLEWTNQAAEELISSAEVDGRSVPVHWKLSPGSGVVDGKRVAFVYESVAPQMRLTWEWIAPAKTGPIEHRIRIENLSSREVWIPLQTTLRFNWRVAPSALLEHVYVEKGAGRPSPVGTHRTTLAAGYRWEGTSSTYARDGEPREIIPWFMVERTQGAHDGWYVGVEFSGRTSLAVERDGASVHGTVGLNPNPGSFHTRLLAKESFDAPPVFLGGFSGGRDSVGNVLRPWVRHVLTNAKTWEDPNYPLLVNNSWGSGMQVDESLATRMIRDSAELGLEMFHIDAGWFRGVGDWYPDPKKFPHGLAVLADQAHQEGLKFGIWVNWAQAGIDTALGALNAHDPKVPDWLVADVLPDWKPGEFVGRTTDLGVPAARDYAQHEVERIVSDYHLDMLEHDGYLVARSCARTDHPHATRSLQAASAVRGSGAEMEDASNSTDVSYHAVHAYYQIYSRIRSEHPDLLFEICNDGGRMVDFGSAAHGDYFSITDAYDPLSNRRAFYDTSQVLPAAMLEDYVEKWPTPKIENFRYMLRSGMMGWLTIMQDTNAWNEEQHSVAKKEFALYKSQLRPLIRDADLYHISDRPDGVHWDGMEYFDPDKRRGVIYAFRGSLEGADQHAFAVQGLRADRQYRLRFQDHSVSDKTVSGSDLLRSGLMIHLAIPNSSELIFIDEAGS